MTLVLMGLGIMMVLAIVVMRQQQVACGCLTNFIIGLLLIGLGLVLLSLAGVIPLTLICEKGPYVSLCLN